MISLNELIWDDTEDEAECDDEIGHGGPSQMVMCCGGSPSGGGNIGTISGMGCR